MKAKKKSAAKKQKRSQKSKSTKTDPLFREVFFRPERYKYVRKEIEPRKDGACVFCSSAKGAPSLESLKIFDGPNTMVLLNKFPYNTGHLLILPKRHVGEMEALKSEELQELTKVLQQSIGILKKTYQCQGLNVGLNLGAVAGAGIPDHIHFHVVPRWAGDTNFFPLLAHTKVVIETLDKTFERLLPLFQDMIV